MSENHQTVSLKRPVNVPDYVVKAQSDVAQAKDIKYPTDVIPLPTKGWFYPDTHPLASGEIELKQMTAREEDILANQELIKKGKVIDKLMESVIVNKSIRVEDLFIPDKDAILLAIRRLAYGDEYKVETTCPRCDKKNRLNINLSELKYKEFDFANQVKGQNNFTFKLPSGVVVTYKLLTQIDSDSIDAELLQLKKISKEASAELTTRLKYTLTSVDGVADRPTVRKFIEERLSAKDSLALRKHIRENGPGVDMGFDFKCTECDHERRMDVPLGASFLWPDIEA